MMKATTTPASLKSEAIVIYEDLNISSGDIIVETDVSDDFFEDFSNDEFLAGFSNVTMPIYLRYLDDRRKYLLAEDVSLLFENDSNYSSDSESNQSGDLGESSDSYDESELFQICDKMIEECLGLRHYDEPKAVQKPKQEKREKLFDLEMFHILRKSFDENYLNLEHISRKREHLELLVEARRVLIQTKLPTITQIINIR